MVGPSRWKETTQMPLQLSVERSLAPSGEQILRLGHELLDDYLTFVNHGRKRQHLSV